MLLYMDIDIKEVAINLEHCIDIAKASFRLTTNIHDPGKPQESPERRPHSICKVLV